MSYQILKVEMDPRDDACLQITLRHQIKRRFFNSKTETRTVVYKGHGRDWYCLPSFTPAPAALSGLLKAISQGPQYKHLRLNLHRKLN